jgi:hypothetical protein
MEMAGPHPDSDVLERPAKMILLIGPKKLEFLDRHKKA